MRKAIVFLESPDAPSTLLGEMLTQVGEIILLDPLTDERAQVVRIQSQGAGKRSHAYARKIA